MIYGALFGKLVDRNASRRSDVAYVAQSLRRLRFPGLSVAIPPETIYGKHDAFRTASCIHDCKRSTRHVGMIEPQMCLR